MKSIKRRVLLLAACVLTLSLSGGCGDADPMDAATPVESLADSLESMLAQESETPPLWTIADPKASGEEKTDNTGEEVTTSAPEETSTEESTEQTPAQTEGPLLSRNGYADGEEIYLSSSWKYADSSAIHSGAARMYLAKENRNGYIIAVNAGHGTSGGESVKTYCHPDGTPKVTGGSTSAGATQAMAVASGMTFSDGTPERDVTYREACLLRDRLLAAGYDVVMIRDGDDVQLDNIARTVISNNTADCHIAIHWDGDGLGYDKGAYFMSVPDGLKGMEPVASNWERCEALGNCLIGGLSSQGVGIFDSGYMDMDLTQTSYSTIASVDIELGNQSSAHDDDTLGRLADGLLEGINTYFSAGGE